ncbi:MAG TPA: ANTAR domain-containing protein, partial [Pilimelia sp.]|nr:ANTAR domain-containing protein [Pilimelia sp.]
QAKGVLMGRHRITPEEAFVLLAEWSQRSNTKLVQIAAAVVAGVAPQVGGGADRLLPPRQPRGSPAPPADPAVGDPAAGPPGVTAPVPGAAAASPPGADPGGSRACSEAERHYPDLVAAERVAGTAAFRWDPWRGAGAWWHSPHLPALLGRPAGPLSPAAAVRGLDPADRAALRRLLAGVWANGGRAALTVLAPGRRWLRVVVTRDGGDRPMLRGAVHDVTELRTAQYRRPGGAAAGPPAQPR